MTGFFVFNGVKQSHRPDPEPGFVGAINRTPERRRIRSSEGLNTVTRRRMDGQGSSAREVNTSVPHTHAKLRFLYVAGCAGFVVCTK